MALDNYQDLLTAISAWSHRGDLAKYYPDFIRLAEQEINKILRLRSNQERSLITPKTNDPYIPIPDGFLEMRSMRVISGSSYSDMMYRSPEAMKRLDGTGKPFFYTIRNIIEFDVIPDKSYQIEMIYYKRLTPLSEDNTTNEILTQYPSLYLNGALAALHRQSRDEETAREYDMLFMQDLKSAHTNENRGRYGVAPTPSYEGYIP